MTDYAQAAIDAIQTHWKIGQSVEWVDMRAIIHREAVAPLEEQLGDFQHRLNKRGGWATIDDNAAKALLYAPLEVKLNDAYLNNEQLREKVMTLEAEVERLRKALESFIDGAPADDEIRAIPIPINRIVKLLLEIEAQKVIDARAALALAEPKPDAGEQP